MTTLLSNTTLYAGASQDVTPPSDHATDVTTSLIGLRSHSCITRDVAADQLYTQLSSPTASTFIVVQGNALIGTHGQRAQLEGVDDGRVSSFIPMVPPISVVVQTVHGIVIVLSRGIEP